MVAGDATAAGSLLTPGAEMRDLRPIVGMSVKGTDLGPAMQAFLELGVTSMDWDVIATRGERLELGRMVMHGGAAANESLMAPGVDADGRIDLYVVHEVDQIDEAIADLDRRFLLGEGQRSEAWRSFIASVGHIDARDLDALTDMIREDFVGVDHRPLGYGEVDRAAFVATYPPMFERAPAARWRLVRDLLVTDRVAVGEMRVTGEQGGGGGGGGAFDVHMVSVLQTCEGMAVRLELFPGDALAAALDRARELLAEEGSI
jgi:hypothetical protein